MISPYLNALFIQSFFENRDLNITYANFLGISFTLLRFQLYSNDKGEISFQDFKELISNNYLFPLKLSKLIENTVEPSQ